MTGSGAGVAMFAAIERKYDGKYRRAGGKQLAFARSRSGDLRLMDGVGPNGPRSEVLPRSGTVSVVATWRSTGGSARRPGYPTGEGAAALLTGERPEVEMAAGHRTPAMEGFVDLPPRYHLRVCRTPVRAISVGIAASPKCPVNGRWLAICRRFASPAMVAEESAMKAAIGRVPASHGRSHHGYSAAVCKSGVRSGKARFRRRGKH